MSFRRSLRHRAFLIITALVWGTLAWGIKTSGAGNVDLLSWGWHLALGLAASILINMLIAGALGLIAHRRREEITVTRLYLLPALLIGIVGGFMLSHSIFGIAGWLRLVGAAIGAIVGWITLGQLRAER